MKIVTDISKKNQSESVDIEWTLSKASTQKRQLANDRKLNIVLINPEDIDAHKRFTELNSCECIKCRIPSDQSTEGSINPAYSRNSKPPALAGGCLP
jgi:hypothetical protein